jgi:hypothetical protein
MIGLYFGGEKFQTIFGNVFGNIELDAVLSEDHQWASDVTTNPVEEGAPVADHIIDVADKLRLKCFVTDAPLVASQSVSGSFNAGTAGTRTQPVFDLLYRLKQARATVMVYTRHASYENMAITDISITRTAETGEALEFDVSFVNIRQVATQTVDLPPGISAKKEEKAGGKKSAIAKKSEPKKDAGKKAAKPVKPPETVSSTLSKWLH